MKHVALGTEQGGQEKKGIPQVWSSRGTVGYGEVVSGVVGSAHSHEGVEEPLMGHLL